MSRHYKLDCLRGFTALYVMFAHAAYQHCFALSIFGQDAVILFFLLSGFVVSHATEREGGDFYFRNFFIKRFRRLYPIYLLGLALAWLGVSYFEGQWVGLRGWDLIGNLFFLQDLKMAKPGVWFNVFFNPNLWSLSYEWFFYFFYFALLKWIPRDSQQRFVFLIAFSATIFYGWVPNQLCLFLSYFSVWWLGVELSREYLQTASVSWRRQRRPLGWVLLVAGAWFSQVVWEISLQHSLSPGLYPILPLRHFLSALLCMGIALYWHRCSWKYFQAIFGIFGRFAPVAYGVYIFQWPILKFAPFFASWPLLPRLSGLCLVVMGFSWLVEVRLQPYITRLTNPLLRRVPEERPESAGLDLLPSIRA